MKKRKTQANCSYLTATRRGSEDSALTALSVTKIDLPQQIPRVVIPVLNFLCLLAYLHYFQVITLFPVACSDCQQFN